MHRLLNAWHMQTKLLARFVHLSFVGVGGDIDEVVEDIDRSGVVAVTCDDALVVGVRERRHGAGKRCERRVVGGVKQDARL